VNDADKGISHHHDMQVRRRKRSSQLLDLLIWEAHHVLQVSGAYKVLYLSQLASAPDEAKHYWRTSSVSVVYVLCGFEQRIQRIARAVVARVHHHKLAFQPMPSPEFAAALRIVSHCPIMRPWRQHDHLLGCHTLGFDPLAHETIQHNDALSLA
jgi:hypothetical protein